MRLVLALLGLVSCASLGRPPPGRCHPERPMPDAVPPTALMTPVDLPLRLKKGFAAAPPPREIANFKGRKSSIPDWSDLFLKAASKEAARAGLSDLELALDLAGLCDRETCGNNVIGDGGHGHGAMQVDDRWHKEWLRANRDGMDPETNIAKGAEIYVDSLVAIRKLNRDKGLGLTEVEVRKAAMCAYNAGVPAVTKQLLIPRRSADLCTTNHNYGSDTWLRREKYRLAVESVSA